jgi:hypothetical protein
MPLRPVQTQFESTLLNGSPLAGMTQSATASSGVSAAMGVGFEAVPPASELRDASKRSASLVRIALIVAVIAIWLLASLAAPAAG